MTTTIRLEKDIEDRLNHLAEETGRSKSFYIRKLIDDYLDDLEDLYIAQHRMETFSGSISLDDIEKKYDLED